jgi:outer membrane biogenesis lipoprotein LolB
MKIIKRFLIPVTVSVVVSMILVGCGKKSEKPAVEQSAKETKSTEHPTEHPTKEHPTEHPSNKEASDDHPSDNK